MLTSRHSLLEEASDAGLLGGSAVALWFLLWDALHGTPLITPSVLGQIFLFGQRHPDVHHADFGAVVLYTGVHFLAFLLLGLVVAVLVRLSAEQAAVRFALLVLFVAFEFCFTVVVNVVSDDAVTLFPLWTVLIANLLAAGVMAAYFWRRYPEIRSALREAPLGA